MERNVKHEQVSPERKWILIADDDPDDIEMLQDAVLALNPTALIKTFKDGKRLLNYIAEDPAELPCAVILDYNMPIINGLDVLKSLRHKPVFSKIPIVVWSTSAMPEQVKACLDSGATDYLVKPSHPEELNRMTQKLMVLAEHHC